MSWPGLKCWPVEAAVVVVVVVAAVVVESGSMGIDKVVFGFVEIVAAVTMFGAGEIVVDA